MKKEIKGLREEMNKIWVGRDGNPDEKMVNYCLKSDDYIKIEDMFVRCCHNKPTIERELLYNDEYNGPETDWDGFYNYNMKYQYKKLQLYFRGCDLYFATSYKLDTKIISLNYYEDWEVPENAIRKVNAEELVLINAKIDEAIERFEKRLKTYYKKYADKITTRGYWADR